MIKPLLLAIIDNPAETTTVRIAAVSILPWAQPSAAQLQKIAVRTWFEPSKQVSSFIYSTLKYLAVTEVPELMSVGLRAKNVMHMVKPHQYGLQFSQNLNYGEFLSYLKTALSKKMSWSYSEDEVIPAKVAISSKLFNSAVIARGLSYSVYTQGMDHILVTIYSEYFCFNLLSINWMVLFSKRFYTLPTMRWLQATLSASNWKKSNVNWTSSLPRSKNLLPSSRYERFIFFFEMTNIKIKIYIICLALATVYGLRKQLHCQQALHDWLGWASYKNLDQGLGTCLKQWKNFQNLQSYSGVLTLTLKGLFYTLKMGCSLNFQVLNVQHIYPTSAGVLTFVETVMPTVYSLKGFLKASEMVSGPRGLPIPKKVVAEISPVVNAKIHTHVGILCPITQQFVGVGIDAAIHVATPLKAKIEISMGELSINLQAASSSERVSELS